MSIIQIQYLLQNKISPYYCFKLIRNNFYDYFTGEILHDRYSLE